MQSKIEVYIEHDGDYCGKCSYLEHYGVDKRCMIFNEELTRYMWDKYCRCESCLQFSTIPETPNTF